MTETQTARALERWERRLGGQTIDSWLASPDRVFFYMRLRELQHLSIARTRFGLEPRAMTDDVFPGGRFGQTVFFSAAYPRIFVGRERTELVQDLGG